MALHDLPISAEGRQATIPLAHTGEAEEKFYDPFVLDYLYLRARFLELKSTDSLNAASWSRWDYIITKLKPFVESSILALSGDCIVQSLGLLLELQLANAHLKNLRSILPSLEGVLSAQRALIYARVFKEKENKVESEQHVAVKLGGCIVDPGCRKTVAIPPGFQGSLLFNAPSCLYYLNSSRQPDNRDVYEDLVKLVIYGIKSNPLSLSLEKRKYFLEIRAHTPAANPNPAAATRPPVFTFSTHMNLSQKASITQNKEAIKATTTAAHDAFLRVAQVAADVAILAAAPVAAKAVGATGAAQFEAQGAAHTAMQAKIEPAVEKAASTMAAALASPAVTGASNTRVPLAPPLISDDPNVRLRELWKDLTKRCQNLYTSEEQFLKDITAVANSLTVFEQLPDPPLVPWPL